MSNDWFNEYEEKEMKRRAFNDIENTARNLTPGEKLFVKIITGALFIAAALLVLAVIGKLILEVFSAGS